MARVTIDGRDLDFEPGETIIQVASRAEIEIPYYCWHPKLSVAANCRMCLVEVEKAPKLVPACQTNCRDGMVVFTKSRKVQETQRAIHEFLLINHPIDCPICDQAGECKLQDYYMKLQLASSRMREEKVHKPRLDRLGAHVLYNAERCILCTRCVRFMEEVAGQRQLGIFHRGDHSAIGTFPEQELDNPYSLNVVDVCPVGALTSTAFRFKQRVWNLSRSDSVCPGCARGCNVHVDQRSGVVYRLLPRDNDDVNQCWLCDEGRLTTSRANDARLTQPYAGGEQTSGSSALDTAARHLLPLAGSGRGLGAAISLQATCEEAYVFGRFASEVLGLERVGLLARRQGEADDFLRLADKNPNRAGVERVLADLGLETTVDLVAEVRRGSIEGLVCLGHEGSESLAEAAAGLEVVIVVAHAGAGVAQAAQVTLPSLAWVQLDGTWLSSTSRLQRLRPAFAPEGEARAAHEWIVDLADRMGIALALASVATIRAEIERTLPSFAASRITAVGPLGHPLGGESC